MKKGFSLGVMASLLLACQPSADNAEKTEKSGYDSVMAQELGADSYGMKPMVIAFLKKGPNRNQDSARAAELQRAHLDNINRLAEVGKLVLAGPFLDTGAVRGIYIFDVASVEEARALTLSDPAIQAGRLEMELRSWYGSAALLKLNGIHEQIAKENP